MASQDLLLEVFCLVDDELQALDLGRLRQRGPQPALADSEVLTIELVGEFWKLGTDQDLFRHFRRYHAAEFPALARVHRTTFARQAANLWRVKQLLHQRLQLLVELPPQTKWTRLGVPSCTKAERPLQVRMQREQINSAKSYPILAQLLHLPSDYPRWVDSPMSSGNCGG
jgi:hypothetical protein